VAALTGVETESHGLQPAFRLPYQRHR